MNSRKIFLKVLNLGPERSKSRFLKLALLHVIVSFADLLSIAFLVSLMAAAIKGEQLAYLKEVLHSFASLQVQTSTVLLAIGLLSFLLFAAKNLLGYKVAKWSLHYARDFSAHVSTQLVEAFYNRGFSYLRNEKIFKITHRTASLPFEFASVTLKSVLSIIAQIAMCVAFLIFSFALDPAIATALLLGALPVIGIMYLRHKRKAVEFGKEKNEKLPSNNRELHKLYESFIELKIYGAEDLFVQKFLHHLNGFNAVRFKQQLLTIYPRRILETVAIGLIVSLFSYRILMSGGPDAFIIDLLVLGVFGYKVIPALANIMDGTVVLNTTRDAQLSLIENLTTELPQIESEDLPKFNRLALQDLSFSIGEAKILDKINFQLTKGEITGIVGRSGEGKSTLLKILMGLLQADSGQTSLNNKRVTFYNNEKWMRKLGFIDADSTMLDMSIYENVSLGTVESEEVRALIEEALSLAGLSEFVGADRSVGEDGKALSSGQKQRLALARALYHKPSVLILDEFTSHLDEETENVILRTIEQINQIQETTVLMVSHRKSAMGIANTIFEVRDKRLVKVAG